MQSLILIQRALLSVSDKTDLAPFAKVLASLGVELISTGGTARMLREAGLTVTSVEEVTEFPEMMDGRVKTLHPRIHGGLLGLRDKESHTQAMAEHGIQPIDLVCVNLYPFEQTIADPSVAEAEAIEQIDIGGPSMVRSAAKNHAFVAVVTDPSQYDRVAQELKQNEGATGFALRRWLAAAAFTRTAAYDSAIAAWMGRSAPDIAQPEPFPDPMVVSFRRVASLRYGENPDQAAALYATYNAAEPGVVSAKQLHGKALSYNNLNDAAAALELVKEFEGPAAAVIKHTNPCGCGVAGADEAADEAIAVAFSRAYSGDPLAAFGGIVALNRPVNRAAALAITGGEKFLEVICAPSFEEDALALLRERWKNVRLLAVGELPAPQDCDRRVLELRTIVGGALVQQRDSSDMASSHWRHVAGPEPDEAALCDLHLAWCAVKHVKSNAITLALDGAIVGVGAGQMDRLESCRIAVAKANSAKFISDGLHRSKGACAASDAFFPFRDGPDALIEAGVRAIVQPGGSKRDDETVQACEDAGVTLMLTGRRHFKH